MRKLLSPWNRLLPALLVLPVLLAAAPRGAGPGLLLRFATGGRAIITAPAVGRDGTLYAASGDGVLYAVWPNGRGRWSLRVGITTGQVPPARPVVGPDGTSYWNLGGSVVAVGPAGHLRWVFLAAGRGSPVLAHGRVLFAAGPYLYAINTTGPAAGRYAWRAAMGAAGAATGGASPAVGSDGTAYVPSPDGNLYAIDPDGLRRWTFSAGVRLGFSPAVGPDGTVYLAAFADGRGWLYALTPRGRLRWRVQVPTGSDVTRGPDGTLYLAAHLLVAVSPRGRILWRRVVDATGAPLAGPGPVVMVPTLTPPALLALGSGGAVRWRVPLAAPAVAAPALGPGGRLYSGDYAGMLTALAPGARGPGRLLGGAAPAGPAVDLGAANPPFTVRSGRLSWRVTLARTVERSVAGGRRWQVVLAPGASRLDQRTGLYHNARYADVAFLAVDPHQPSGLYVGTVGALGDYLAGGAGGSDGGLYYSPDGTTRWRPLDSGLPFTYEPRLHVPTYGLDALVADPAQPSVLYVQTLATYGAPGHSPGLYKSTDGGRHWHLAAQGLQPVLQANTLIGAYRAYPPGTLLIDPERTGVLFLIAPTGFYRSADAAGHWRRVSAVRYADPLSVTVRIGVRGVVDVGTDRDRYVSADFGARWRSVAS